jgi:anaerobic magnesium-protoporphyrin IX monomethyl ester cyclase
MQHAETSNGPQGGSLERSTIHSRSSHSRSRRVLIVDLNNFASFPTLAIGLLVATLRNAGHRVDVLCPLAYDVPAVARERRELIIDHWKRRLHLSTSSAVRWVRDTARSMHDWWSERPHPKLDRMVKQTIARDQPDIVLLSAYLRHYRSVKRIAANALESQIPVLLGGPMFNVSGVSAAWRDLPGVTAIVGAESDKNIASLVEAVCDRRPLNGFPGLTLPDGTSTGAAPPLRDLDETPIPDFTDFPWDRYPVRIVPMMTGRGCQWNRCVFCSDIVSASGRSFRTRSLQSVLIEMQEQASRHQTKNFLFLDLKLNSYPDLFRGIAAEAHRYVPGAEWVGTVHVDLRSDNGLSRRDLMAAVTGGMRRISFGLESGSQRLLDLMDKGSSVEANSEFIHNAHDAGLSVRCTMFKGFPGETAEDMAQTASFLETHVPYLDRVRFNEFSLLEDTPIYEAMLRQSSSTAKSLGADAQAGKFKILRLAHRKAKADYLNLETNCRAYRRAKRRALAAVYAINRKPIRSAARQFDGLM